MMLLCDIVLHDNILEAVTFAMVGDLALMVSGIEWHIGKLGIIKPSMIFYLI